MPPFSTRHFHVSQDVDPQRKEEIQKIAEETIAKISLAEPPLSFEKLVAAFPEIEIVEIPNLPISCELEYLDEAKTKVQIKLREGLKKSAKLLDICHALGHWILHPAQEFSCRMDFFGDPSVEEAEATYFAELLLMPKSAVTQCFEECSEEPDPIYKLSKQFKVKRQIMEDRLISLQLIQE